MTLYLFNIDTRCAQFEKYFVRFGNRGCVSTAYWKPSQPDLQSMCIGGIAVKAAFGLVD